MIYHSIQKASPPLGVPTHVQNPHAAPAHGSLIGEARRAARRFKAAWTALSSEASRLKHEVSFKVRDSVARPLPDLDTRGMDQGAKDHLSDLRPKIFDIKVDHMKVPFDRRKKGYEEKKGESLFDQCLKDDQLFQCQYRYLEQLGRTGIHVDHADAASEKTTRDRPLNTLDEHIATIGQMVDRLGILLEKEQAKEKPARSADVIAKMKEHISNLTTEKRYLQQRTRPLLKKLFSAGWMCEKDMSLKSLINLGKISESDLNEWRAHDFSVLDAVRASEAGMSFDDFARLVNADTTQQDLPKPEFESIHYLVRAKAEFPAMSADNFKQLAPQLLKEKPSLNVIRLMDRNKIPLNAHTLPVAVELDGDVGVLGAGSLNKVYRVPLQGNLIRVFKPEGDEVDAKAALAGVGAAKDGANLSGRTLVSAAVAKHLGIESAPDSQPVALDIPGKGLTYGTLSDFVPGATLTSGTGDSADIRLEKDQYVALQGLTPDALNGVAQRFGFEKAELTSSDDGLQLKLSKGESGQFAVPLDLNSPQVRESASRLGFWAAITAQLDLHRGNVKLFVKSDGRAEVVSFDNDLCAGKLNHHPNAAIADSLAHHEEWQQAIRRCVDQARSGSQDVINLPEKVGLIQRKAILAMTQDRFNARYKSADLTPEQQAQAWASYEDIQRRLKAMTKDGQPDIPIVEVEWEVNKSINAIASGIPKVIPASLKTSILDLDEATVRNEMFGALGPDEQAAGWSRVMAIQDELSIPDHIQVAQTSDEWLTDKATKAMGLDAQELETTAIRWGTESAREGKDTTLGASMRHGILANWAILQTLSRLCAEGSTSPSNSGQTAPNWETYQELPAWFDQKAILDAALKEAAALQAKA